MSEVGTKADKKPYGPAAVRCTEGGQPAIIYPEIIIQTQHLIYTENMLRMARTVTQGIPAPIYVLDPNKHYSRTDNLEGKFIVKTPRARTPFLVLTTHAGVRLLSENGGVETVRVKTRKKKGQEPLTLSPGEVKRICRDYVNRITHSVARNGHVPSLDDLVTVLRERARSTISEVLNKENPYRAREEDEVF